MLKNDKNRMRLSYVYRKKTADETNGCGFFSKTNRKMYTYVCVCVCYSKLISETYQTRIATKL